MRIDNGGNEIVVKGMVFAGDLLSHHDPLFGTLVSQHGAPNDIADRPDSGSLGRTLFGDKDGATLIHCDACILGEQILGLRPTTHRNNQAVKNLGVTVVTDSVGNMNLAVLNLSAGHPGSQADIKPLLFEQLLALFGNLLIHSG